MREYYRRYPIRGRFLFGVYTKLTPLRVMRDAAYCLVCFSDCTRRRKCTESDATWHTNIWWAYAPICKYRYFFGRPSNLARVATPSYLRPLSSWVFLPYFTSSPENNPLYALYGIGKLRRSGMDVLGMEYRALVMHMVCAFCGSGNRADGVGKKRGDIFFVNGHVHEKTIKSRCCQLSEFLLVGFDLCNTSTQKGDHRPPFSLLTKFSPQNLNAAHVSHQSSYNQYTVLQ